MVKFHLLAACSLPVISLLMASSAFAQSPSAPRTPAPTSGPQNAQGRASNASPASGQATTDDIIVTARKRNERLLDVPETINAFSGETLTKGGIRTIDDLGRAVPNINMNRRADNEPNVVIRGIGSFGNVQGVGFYVDDVQNFTDQAARLVDLERVEVLKGPQGTLYGGNSIGGAVKFVTRKPSDALESSFRVEAGERRTTNIAGSINLPITDNLFFRTSAYSDNTDGYSRNPITGINNDESREYGIRAALRYAPSDATDVLLSLRHSYLNNGGQDYVLVNAVDDYRYDNPLNVDVFNKRRIWSGTLAVNQDVGGATLTSLTSYTERRVGVHWDLDYTALDIVSTPNGKPIQKTPVFTQELRLTSKGDEPVSWIAGLYYARIRDRIIGISGPIILGTAATGGDPITLEGYRAGRSIDKNYAAFGDLTFRQGPLEITAGARLNYNDFTGSNGNIPATLSIKDTIVLPKVSASYKLKPDMLIYATAAKGYEPGKTNLFSSELFPYRAETAVNYEVGLKGQLPGGLLSYELAGFYITNKNRQFETQIKDATGTPVDLTSNIGTSRSYGGEASFTLRPVRGLTLNVNGGYLHARYRRAQFRGVNYENVTVPNAPSFSGYASADYSVPLNGALRLNLRGDVSHTSSVYWDVPNRGRQESYEVLGLRAAIASSNDTWEFAVRADNLFNKAYNTEFFYNFGGDPTLDPTRVNATCDACHLARVGQPRQVLASFSYRFR